MHESVTLIEQTNIFNKTKKNDLKNLSFNVYSSQYLKTNKSHHRSDEIILPSIDKDQNRYRRKIKPPFYPRTKLNHSSLSNSSQIDLSLLTARGIKPDSVTTIRDDDTVINLQRHHAPPPSPSDDQLERILYEFSQTRQSTPRTPINKDGHIPYRLPALHQTNKRRHTDLNFSSKDIKTTSSSYF